VRGGSAGGRRSGGHAVRLDDEPPAGVRQVDPGMETIVADPHPRHPGLAPLYIAGQCLLDGLVGGEHLREYERVLERHGRTLRHVR